MSKELRASMHENTAWLEDVDEILEHDAPAVFKRYQDASEQERIHMEVCLLAHTASSDFPAQTSLVT